jgi:hypothetical protein
VNDRSDESLKEARFGLLGSGNPVGQGSVAGLAVYVRVLAGFLGVRDIGVAGLACLMAGKLCGVSGDVTERGPAVVAILPESFGDNVVAHHEKRQECEDEEPRKPE